MKLSEQRAKRTPGNQKECLRCGVVFGAPVLFGLCPNCLLKAGLEGGPATSIEAFDPPSLESLAEAIHEVEPLELIGRGGMGAVYKARQYILNRVVALKVLPPPGAYGGNIIYRFEREARLLARLRHRNVVAIHGFGAAGKFPYFIMDFVEGQSLRQMLKSGPLSPPYAVKLFLQLCDGLQHAHQNGVVHRDIKPANLLLDEGGVLKIADFGLAKLNGAGTANEWKTPASRTMGTPHYMAPEQVENLQAVDLRADIYSAGVVLYEMLTGELPLGRFPGPSQKAKVDPSLDVVVFRALEKDSARRFQDISEFKQAVKAVMFKKKRPLPKMIKSESAHRPAWQFSGQLAQWAEAVTGRVDSGHYHPGRFPGQLAQWAEVVAAKVSFARGDY